MRKNALKSTFAMMFFMVNFTACSVEGESSSSLEFAVNPSGSASATAGQIYNLLVGEIYSSYGEIDKSLSFYMKVVKENNSPEVAQRVTELAAQANDNESALLAAQQWNKASPDSFDAHQHLALLNIRLDKPETAVKDLLWIQKHLDKKKKHGVAFVASLVSFETNKESAYKAFKLFAQQSGEPNEANLALAALAINAGDFDGVLEAVSASRKSSKQAIKDRANLYYAKAMMSLNREKEAITEMKAAVKSSSNADLKLEYARLLVLAGEHGEAEMLFKQLYRDHPNNADILYTLGLLYIDMERFTDAQPLFVKLTKMPNMAKNGEVHYFLGKIYEEQGQYENALLEYGNAENTELYKEAKVSKTKLIFKEKGLASAREYLQKRIESAEGEEEAISLLLVDGELLYKEKKYEEALKSYQRILDLKPNDVDGLYSRSLVYSQLGNIKDAERDLLKILKDAPDNVTALNALGYSLVVATTRFEEARKYIAKALKLEPDDPAIIDSMGWVEYHIGNLVEAEKLLRKAYKNLPDAEVASHLIEVLSKTGKTEEAKILLSDMLKKHPKDEKLLAVKKKLPQLDASK